MYVSKLTILCFCKMLFQLYTHTHNLKSMLLSERSRFWKATCCIILLITVWPSGRVKTIETAKRSVILLRVGGGYEYTQQRGFLGQWKYYAWFYYGGWTWISFFVHLSRPTEGRHQEQTVMQTITFGWLWWVNAGSSSVTSVPSGGSWYWSCSALWEQGVPGRPLYLPLTFTVILKLLCGNPLTVQWLGLPTYTAEGLGSIAGQGTRILQGSRHSQKSINECCRC